MLALFKKTYQAIRLEDILNESYVKLYKVNENIGEMVDDLDDHMDDMEKLVKELEVEEGKTPEQVIKDRWQIARVEKVLDLCRTARTGLMTALDSVIEEPKQWNR